jgi:hypothetical protein
MTAVVTLNNVAFALVIADGFSSAASANFMSTQTVLQESGGTPGAQFLARGFEQEQAPGGLPPRRDVHPDQGGRH